MKKLLFVTMALVALIIVAGARAIFVERAQAQDLAECTVGDVVTPDRDRIGLLVCERGKPLPKEYEGRLTDGARNWLREVPETEKSDASAPSGVLASTWVEGADFNCGNGVRCTAYGALPPFVAISLDWYRVSGIHVDSDWGFCNQEYGCFFQTDYWPTSNHAGDWVQITSQYAFDVYSCECGSGSGTCDTW